MKKTLTLVTLLTMAMMSGCASTGETKGTGNTAFDEAAQTAMAKNATALKAGYAWTSAAVKTKYDPKTEAGKAYQETGRKLTLVDVAIYEGEEALKKGDEAKAMKQVKLANELADAQLAQKENGDKYQLLWK